MHLCVLVIVLCVPPFTSQLATSRSVVTPTTKGGLILSAGTRLAFRHRMYPVTVTSREGWLTVILYSQADCKWTHNGRFVPRIFIQPHHDYIRTANKLNAFMALHEGEFSNFTCTCSLTMAGQNITFAVDFFVLKSKADWWRSRGLTEFLVKTKQYPLLESCMQRTIEFEDFYHLYLENQYDKLYKPYPCPTHGKQYHPHFYIRPVFLKTGVRSIQVRCDFRGQPRPTVSFLFNGKRIHDGKSLRIGANKVTFLHPDKKDSGFVSCRGDNRHGTGYMSTLLFVVSKTYLNTNFVVDERVVRNQHDRRQRHIVLECPRPLHDIMMLVVWAREAHNSTRLEFVARGVHRLNISSPWAGGGQYRYLCVVCGVNRCRVNRFEEPEPLHVIEPVVEVMKPPEYIPVWRDITKSRVTVSLSPSTTAMSTSTTAMSTTFLYTMSVAASPEKDHLDTWQMAFWILLGSGVVFSFLFLILILTTRLLYGHRSPIAYQVKMTKVRKNSDESTRTSSTGFTSSRNGSTYTNFNEKTQCLPGPDYVPMTLDSVDTASLENRCRLQRQNLSTIRSLGEGAFGQVTLARVQVGPLQGRLVAIKELKETCADYLNLSSLTHEVQVLRTLGMHPNIVRLLGSSTDASCPFMATEFCEKGSLRHYLTTRCVTVSQHHLIGFVRQVARGMEYVSGKQFLHCDLAARNVFLTDAMVCKIADFGMARRVGEEDGDLVPPTTALPVRWLAPEVILEKKFSKSTDVWSFGILVWEIFAMCGTPYQGYKNREIFSLLSRGYRLERPEICPPAIWSVVKDSWSAVPELRPSFRDIVRRLELPIERRYSITRRRRSLRMSC